MFDKNAFDSAVMFAPIAQVEAHLADFLNERPLPTNLRNAAKYAVFGPGKRLRPLLVMRACQAAAGDCQCAWQQALTPASAIEMVHCFSLVHDDLPAMDNDDLRRGRPTLHKYTNDAMAILAGDLLSSLAFEILAQELPSPLSALLVKELAIGTNDMIAGQVYDSLPDFPADMPAMEKLRTIHRNKTGALIRCACRMGAITAIGSDQGDAVEALTKYGELIGLMFQVVDDVLDVTQTTEQLGKTAGKDVAQQKLTYPALIGLEASKQEIERLAIEATDSLKPLGASAQPLIDLCRFMAIRSK